MNLVPIKVKIGLRSNGHADHPDWYKLPLAKEVNPASEMFFGWKYDKTSGHKETSFDSPHGMQWGMVFVTPRFAREAKQIFPELITELTEVEAEVFWNEKAYAHVPENKVDVNLLQALKAEVDLYNAFGLDGGLALQDKVTKALDPNNPKPGIRKNKDKYFQDAKISLGFNVVTSAE